VRGRTINTGETTQYRSKRRRVIPKKMLFVRINWNPYWMIIDWTHEKTLYIFKSLGTHLNVRKIMRKR